VKVLTKMQTEGNEKVQFSNCQKREDLGGGGKTETSSL